MAAETDASRGSDHGTMTSTGFPMTHRTCTVMARFMRAIQKAAPQPGSPGEPGDDGGHDEARRHAIQVDALGRAPPYAVFSGTLTRICSSRSCLVVAGAGAPISRSSAC